MTLSNSDVPARLGLKAGALAWPKTALAFKIVKPSCEPKPGQSQSLALPEAAFGAKMELND